MKGGRCSGSIDSAAGREGGCALEGATVQRARNRGADVPSPRRDPLEDNVSSTVAEDNEQRIERGQPDLYVPLRGSRIAGIDSVWPDHPMPLGSDAATAPGDRARSRLTYRSIEAGRRTGGTASPARLPRRRRHRPRSPGTSPATAAARRPRSASGTRSTVPAASPAARDASPEDERRSTAGRSRCRPRLQIRRGSTAPLGQPTRHHPQRPWPNRRLMDAPRPG